MGSSSKFIQRKRVDLPLPEGPIIATFSEESGAENPFPKGPVKETVFPTSTNGAASGED